MMIAPRDTGCRAALQASRRSRAPALSTMKTRAGRVADAAEGGCAGSRRAAGAQWVRMSESATGGVRVAARMVPATGRPNACSCNCLEEARRGAWPGRSATGSKSIALPNRCRSARPLGERDPKARLSRRWEWLLSLALPVVSRLCVGTTWVSGEAECRTMTRVLAPTGKLGESRRIPLGVKGSARRDGREVGMCE